MSKEYENLKKRLLKRSRWNGDCLESTYCRTRGYPQIGFKKKVIYTHRASWLIFRGEIPNGFCVCHHCDNPLCINPNHLFLGTHKDNMDDRKKKNKGKYSKDLIKKVFYLRQSGVKFKDIKRIFNIPIGSISWVLKKPFSLYKDDDIVQNS